MSLTDPSTRWWNSSAVRRVAAGVCWTVSFALCLATGWSFEGLWSTPPDAPNIPIAVLFPVSLVLALLGMFLHFAADQTGSEQDFNPRVVFLPVAGFFLGQGLGGVVHQLVHGRPLSGMPVIFAVAGALAILGVELITRRVLSNRALRTRVRRSGIRTRGRVTRALRYSENYSTATRVTVQFTDTEGRTRWASQSVGGGVPVGSILTVQYSPEHLHRRAGIVLTRIR